MAALVLVPGLMCDEAVWAAQVAALTGHDCVIAQHGLLDSLTDMARKALHEAPAGRFSLAGHSMGGRVALEMQRLAPERIERLALLDTGFTALPGGEAGEREKAFRFGLLATARERRMRVMAADWARGMVHPRRIGTPLFEAVLDMLERSSIAQFEAQIAALLGRPDATAQLASITCPTLVLCGEQDGWAPVAQHEALYRGIAGSTLKVVSDCGHMCTMEQADEITAALARWLT
jgi:pimeloyl-ACP methyl ester carboxylesterase